MEIIQLGPNDTLKNPPRNNEQIEKKDLGELKVTALKQGARNLNRVNVYINNKFQFSLDITQVVDTLSSSTVFCSYVDVYRINNYFLDGLSHHSKKPECISVGVGDSFRVKVGNIITPTQLLEYKKASEFGKLYQRTLEWVLTRPRSIKETRDYLFRKLRQKKIVDSPEGRKIERIHNLPDEDLANISDEIISRLISKKYLDDLNFAKYYAENRFAKKGISKKRLKMELIKKGIPSDIVEQVAEQRNDKEEILKIIAKKHNKYDDDKLIAYLCRQGFDYQLVQSLVRDCGMD